MATETEKLAAEIIRIYPEMFQGKNLDMVPWSSGLGVDLGWYPIIKRLVTTIKENDDLHNLEHNTRVVTKVADIKEKWGTLRFVPLGSTLDKNWDAIDQAEEESDNTCESCGSTENVGKWTKGWMVTCCRPCAEKRLEFQSHKLSLNEVFKPNNA